MNFKFGGSFSIPLLLIIAIVFIISYYIKTLRALVSRKEFMTNALSQISVQLNSRWDLITRMAQSVGEFSRHEYETLQDIIKNRQVAINPNTVSSLNKLVESSDTVFSRIIAVAEAYPDLKSSTLFHDLNSTMTEIEDKVRLSRMTYNDTVTRYNVLVKSFPSNIVAKLSGHQTEPYLAEPSGKTEMPELDFHNTGKE